MHRNFVWKVLTNITYFFSRTFQTFHVCCLSSIEYSFRSLIGKNLGNVSKSTYENHTPGDYQDGRLLKALCIVSFFNSFFGPVRECQNFNLMVKCREDEYCSSTHLRSDLHVLWNEKGPEQNTFGCPLRGQDALTLVITMQGDWDSATSPDLPHSWSKGLENERMFLFDWTFQTALTVVQENFHVYVQAMASRTSVESQSIWQWMEIRGELSLPNKRYRLFIDLI